MEFRHLISFEKAASMKSFSKAAQMLYISQPAVTAHISELERELQTRLFLRNTSPVELTETGRIILNYTKQILLLLEQAVAEVRNFENGLRGVINICASESITEWLTSYLNKYKINHPDIDIKLSIYLSTVSLEKILNREAHIGFIKQSKPVFTHKELFGVKVSENQGIIVFSPKHYLARYTVIPKDLFSNSRVRIPTIIFGKQTDFGVQVQEILRQNNINFDDSVDISHSETIRKFLKKSNRVAFMPRELVQHDLDEGSLITRPIENFPTIMRYGIMIYHKDTTSQFVLKFIENLLADQGLSHTVPNPHTKESRL